MSRKAPSTTIDWYRLDCHIQRDIHELGTHLYRGLDTKYLPRGLERVTKRKIEIQRWMNALNDLRNEAARNSTPELVQEWMQLRQQMVMRGPLGIRRSLVSHRTRHYELEY